MAWLRFGFNRDHDNADDFPSIVGRVSRFVSVVIWRLFCGNSIKSDVLNKSIKSVDFRGLFIYNKSINSNERQNRYEPERVATMAVYGYVRISTKKQSIERQIRNIRAAYPEATIIEEVYTGTSLNRREWSRLRNKLKEGDTVVFDSVSRMSRTADEGVEAYFELYGKGVSLVFLKEPTISTAVYAEALKNRTLTISQDDSTSEGRLIQSIISALNDYQRELAAAQIRIAFAQAEKEVEDLHQRTREGIQTARLNGKQIGAVPGKKLITKKSVESKMVIRKHSRDFNGSLNDVEVMKLTGLSRNAYYKYKKELKGEM